jgi:hypothetical protein
MRLTNEGGNMKKIIAIVTALMIGGSALVTAPAAQALTKKEIRYVKLLKSEAPELYVVGNKRLVKSGKLTCRYLRSGATVVDAIELIEDAGLDQDTAIAIVAAAVVFFCPEEEDYI